MSADYLIYDFETFDTTPTSVVIAISIACGQYKKQGLKAAFEDVCSNARTYRLRVKTQVGRTTSKSTIEFWQNNPEAMELIKNIPTQIDILDLEKAFKEVMEQGGYTPNTTVWIRAPHFDHPMLADIMKNHIKSAHEAPYNHWNVRDVRTALDVATGSKRGYPENIEAIKQELGVVKHHPVHDIALDIALLDEFVYNI